jgi:hypothetical protein
VNVPVVEWETFLANWPKQYEQGQHVTIIGPTGSGKTTLAMELVKARGWVVALGVKYRDDTMSRLEKEGWHRVQEWKQRPRSSQRVLVWPKESDLTKVLQVHKKVFTELLRDIYRIGHWTIWTDELTYMTDHVGLSKLYRALYILARSGKISLVGSAQRPAFVPLEAYSQASHLFLFRTGDERDLERMGGMNGVNRKQVADTVSQLPHHTFLHVNLVTGSQVISQVRKGK